MSAATLITAGPRPAVRLERQLPDAPSVVWAALTDRDQLATWFPCDVVVAGGVWRPGADITFPFPKDVIDMTLTGRVLQVEEHKLLVFSWGEETLRFELTGNDRGTLLVLIDELPAGAAARNAAGWDVCLDRLAGVATEGDGWRPRFDTYVAAFEPVIGHQDGPPAGYKGG